MVDEKGELEQALAGAKEGSGRRRPRRRGECRGADNKAPTQVAERDVPSAAGGWREEGGPEPGGAEASRAAVHRTGHRRATRVRGEVVLEEVHQGGFK